MGEGSSSGECEFSEGDGVVAGFGFGGGAEWAGGGGHRLGFIDHPRNMSRGGEAVAAADFGARSGHYETEGRVEESVGDGEEHDEELSVQVRAIEVDTSRSDSVVDLRRVHSGGVRDTCSHGFGSRGFAGIQPMSDATEGPIWGRHRGLQKRVRGLQLVVHSVQPRKQQGSIVCDGETDTRRKER
jgi:hypothetical protein